MYVAEKLLTHGSRLIAGDGVNELPIQVERAVFPELLAHMQIPPRFVESMAKQSGHYSTFVSHDEQDGQVQPESICRCCGRSGKLADIVTDFMVSTPVSKWRAFSCCLRYRLADGDVSGLILHSNKGQDRFLPQCLERR